MERKRILFKDDEGGQEWVVTYHLGYDDVDDDMEGSDTEEIIFNATDIDVAVRYAQQYLRKMQIEEGTSGRWANAQILSVELH